MAIKRGKLLLLGGILLAAALPAAFFLRKPLVVVSDLSFEGLYGRRRSGLMRLETSLRLFRPVKAVLAAEDAGPDLIAFAVEAAAAAPYCVLFPRRYSRGAERYIRRFPGVPAAVLGAGEDGPGVPVWTSTEDDWYRAGISAALFAWAGLTGGRAGDAVLVFGDPSAGEKAALAAGLRERGHTGELRYAGEGGALAGVSCVIVTGPAPAFFERMGNGASVPVILFSWVDPALTPREVKLIFDDSPWALAAGAAALAVRGEGGGLPSRMIVLNRRIPEKSVLRGVKKAKNQKRS
jgi:hypothetical protein